MIFRNGLSPGRQSSQDTTLSIFVDLHAVAAKLSSEDNRPICACCDKGRLVMIDERPDPNFGILGMFQQTLKCDSPECGELTVV